jgi:conjugal transfer pilus assembly protein TraV
MRMSPIIAALGLMPLAGCSLFHSNVKGGFVCSAPRGTCAPSTTIDDSAIHAIDAEAEAKDAPPTPDGEPAANGSQASTNPKEKKAWTFVGPARPVLKIVYMPWRDGSGRLHPAPQVLSPSTPRILPRRPALRWTRKPWVPGKT